MRRDKMMLKWTCNILQNTVENHVQAIKAVSSYYASFFQKNDELIIAR